MSLTFILDSLPRVKAHDLSDMRTKTRERPRMRPPLISSQRRIITRELRSCVFSEFYELHVKLCAVVRTYNVVK